MSETIPYPVARWIELRFGKREFNDEQSREIVKLATADEYNLLLWYVRMIVGGDDV